MALHNEFLEQFSYPDKRFLPVFTQCFVLASFTEVDLLIMEWPVELGVPVEAYLGRSKAADG